MKVLLLNQFFHPDLAATAQIATDLAEDLAAQGLEVTALAAQGTYLGSARLPREETYRGVRIVRVPCTSLGKASIARRMADYGSFFLSAAARVLAGTRHDVVVAMSTPPLVASLGGAARALRGTRFVYWLQDVYPELAVEFGVLSPGSLAARGFDAVSRWTLRRADAVVVLGEAMAQRVRGKGVSSKRVHVIPNWADGAAIRPVGHDTNDFRREHGLDGKRVVLYSGNMGRGHDMGTILDAARRLRDVSDVVFLFVGEGAKRREVEAAARELANVKVLPYQPRERLAESLSAGDVHVVSQDRCTEGLIEPSKLYGVLAAGRGVLYVGPPGSEVARTISAEGVGEVVANGDGASAAAALDRLLGQTEAIGVRARAAFDREYDRRHRTARFAELLRAVAA